MQSSGPVALIQQVDLPGDLYEIRNTRCLKYMIFRKIETYTGDQGEI